jgi:dipeptidyl aminopeptidase/acylaminoacyl peptidase
MRRKLPSISCALLALTLRGLALGQTTSPGSEPIRPVEVTDSIGMTQVGTPATFSPDGKKLVVVTRRGNLEKNTNDFSLLLFYSADVFRSPRAEVLLTLSSGSNNPAISNVRWLADSITICFLGEKPGQKQQIYSLDIKNRKLKQLTEHPTDILAFDVTANLRSIAYLARQPVTSVLDETARTRGLLISNQYLADLLVGHNSENLWASPAELFLMRDRKRATRVFFENRETPIVQARVWLSPDGDFATISTNTQLYEAPKSWKEYWSPYVGDHQATFLACLLIDTRTGSVRILNDAPGYATGGVAWSADGKSLVVTNSYLTLDIEDTVERETRKTTRWVVEVEANGNRPKKIVQVEQGYDYELLKWDLSTNTVFLRAQGNTVIEDSLAGETEGRVIAYRKSGDQWEKVDATVASAAWKAEFDIREEQDMNMPPRLFAVNQKTGAKSLFLDLNPQFRTLRFGHVEEITWIAGNGAEGRGGLYFPPDFVAGLKYPLIIQTHGWNPNEFSIDGLSTAGYAAQALAGKGFVVAQVRVANDPDTAGEGPKNMAMFEGLIESLDRRGLIDRNRVGLQGWSRTGYHVRYTLAFSKYAIAAAAVADGMDGGYWQYVVEANLGARVLDTYERQNGAAPFGKGLQEWLNYVPSFNLDRVQSPVRQLGFGQYWFDYNWESFVGLKRLGKPVEMIWLPDALHAPVKPLERVTVQQGNVDWFCFWLKGEEDPDPAKAEQYARWRDLRKLQEENDAKAKAAPVN